MLLPLKRCRRMRPELPDLFRHLSVALVYSAFSCGKSMHLFWMFLIQGCSLGLPWPLFQALGSKQGNCRCCPAMYNGLHQVSRISASVAEHGRPLLFKNRGGCFQLACCILARSSSRQFVHSSDIGLRLPQHRRITIYWRGT